MPRYSLAAASLFVALPAVAQTAAPDAIAPRPAASLGADARLGAVPDGPLADEELARRLAALHARQADLLAADADGQRDRYVRLLDDLAADLNLLAQRPGVAFDARFRALSAAILTEQERFYGEPALDRGDVYALREAGIRAVELGVDNGAPLLEHVTLPDRATYATTIPMDVNAHVERYVQFLVNRRGHVERLHQRADTYFPMIERVLAEEGVPDELKYLAMVESALNPIAQSHMAAAGLWQFIRPTGAAYGLEARADVDDRLDPERATRAAARHLRDLHDRFGDWQLALAGYNCNPAVVARAIRRFEERSGRRATFWDIMDAIPRETRAYVPMFIATSLVASNPAAYGLSLSNEPGVPYAFDRVPVAAGTPLAEVARVAGTTEAVVRALNPSFRSSRVPDGRESVRLPLGLYADAAPALEALAPRRASGLMVAAETVQFGPRAVRPIAPQERMQALQVAAARQASRPRRADAPVVRPNAVDRYAAAPPAELAVFEQRQAREAARSAPAAAALAAQLAAAEARAADAERRAAALEGRVATAEARLADAPPVALVAALPTAGGAEAGPTEAAALAAQLAAAEARAADAEARADALAEQIAAAEQEAEQAAEQIAQAEQEAEAAARRAAEALAEARSAEARAAEAARPPVRVVSAPAERRAPTTHRVGRGETLSGIAAEYGLTVQQLRDYNGIEGNALMAGRTLRLTGAGAPARSGRARAATPAAPTTYTVRPGDNLTRIAQRFGVSVAELQQWNRLSGGGIRAGQTLRVARPTRG